VHTEFFKHFETLRDDGAIGGGFTAIRLGQNFSLKEWKHLGLSWTVSFQTTRISRIFVFGILMKKRTPTDLNRQSARMRASVPIRKKDALL